MCLVCKHLASAAGLRAENVDDAVAASGSATIIGVGRRLFSSRVGVP